MHPALSVVDKVEPDVVSANTCCHQSTFVEKRMHWWGERHFRGKTDKQEGGIPILILPWKKTSKTLSHPPPLVLEFSLSMGEVFETAGWGTCRRINCS